MVRSQRPCAEQRLKEVAAGLTWYQLQARFLSVDLKREMGRVWGGGRGEGQVGVGRERGEGVIETNGCKTEEGCLGEDCRRL